MNHEAKKKKKLSFAFFIIFLLPIFIPFIEATITVNSGVIFKTQLYNAQFVMGDNFDFYQVELNSTNLWMDKTYTTKHYTRYCLIVLSPNNTQFTIDSWFATKDSTAQITITSPVSTDINLGFHSPNLISASVTGAVSSSWNDANKTLSMTVNSDTNPTFIINAVVTETGEENTNPMNYEVEITDMEGCGNWLFAEEEYYTFQAQFWDGDGYDDLDIMKIAFTDGLNWINASYDGSWSLDSGSNVANIKSGTTTILDPNLIQITFPIYLESSILDDLNVDIWMWCSDTEGDTDGWELKEADYFHIYNLGGQSTLETNGDAGRSTGGEVFELYASTSGSWARANTTIRKLQHMHTLVSLGVPKANGGYCIDNAGGSYAAHTYTGYFEFGIDYCLDDVWLEGWKCRIEVDDALIHSTDVNPFVGDYNFVMLNVSWWYKGELIVSNDIIYAWYEGWISGEHDVIMVWVDLWFNTVNASSTVGGRVAAYRNGWANNRAIIGNITQSMFFTDLLDENNQTFSASRLDMMNLYAVVNKTGCNHYWDLRDYDLFNKLHAQGQMMGIDTPIFVAPKDPDMPATGFLQPLWTAIKGLTDRVAHAITTGALVMWSTFVQFLDTAFSMAGFPNGFSTILGYIQSFFTYMIDGIGYALSLLQSMFLLMTSWLSVAITQFTSMATGLIVIFDVLAYIYAQAESGWVSISSFVTPLLPLIPLALIVWILNARNFEGSIKRVKILWDLLASVVSMFLRIADLVWNYITGLIEGVPVVE